MSKKENTTKQEDKKVEKQQDVEQENDVQGSEAVSESAEAEVETEVNEMDEKLATLNDKYLRLYSEYENYRKRTNAEKADLLLNGSRETIKAILPVVDDLERAMAANADDEGLRLIYNKFMKILGQKGLKAMECQGEKFDEGLHEAITRIPATTPEQKGCIVDVVEKGYYLNDKVLRYAKVVVAF